jgi:formate C-acetyltransferase
MAGESLADGLAPSDGTDRLGPTASLNSVAALDQERFGNGANLNLKLDTGTLASGVDADRVKALILGYFDQGGLQIQFNVLDPEVLRDALVHPEKHRDLLVRVSGYSAYFVDLTPEMQQEIIDRTGHSGGHNGVRLD